MHLPDFEHKNIGRKHNLHLRPGFLRPFALFPKERRAIFYARRSYLVKRKGKDLFGMSILHRRGIPMRESLYDFCIRQELQQLLDQWVAEANLPLTPASISRGSKRKVWWQCKKGHRWQAAVHARTGNGTGCPVCAGKVAQEGENDLAALFPELAHQWHPTRNGNLSPTQVLPGSQRTVWWICKKGHEWRAQIKSRVAGCGCPVCTNREIRLNENDFASKFPVLADQWHPTKNESLTPEQVPPGTTRKVW